MNFLSPDSKFAQVMTTVGEIMLLNFCWIIGSLPLITLGASNAAMYTVMGRRLRGESSGTVVPFFKAWWSNLKQGSLLWLAQALISFSLGMILFLPLPGFLKVLAVVLLLLVTLVFSILYPQLARFRNRWFAYLRNAVILLVLRLGWVALNLVLMLTPLLLFLLAPAEALRLGLVWLLFGFAVLFHLSARIMQKVLQPLEDLSTI
ncbi:MAG: YesL family protein [Oscillospiraceae bacterium]|nr:YesL family protein [Oscillospiraceae bacterium]